jgi:DNA invertase Pin-like site-specific DNA recombinase
MASQDKRIAYIRVSSFGQNPERQLEGIKLDKTFIDKASGGSTPKTPKFLSGAVYWLRP